MVRAVELRASPFLGISDALFGSFARHPLGCSKKSIFWLANKPVGPPPRVPLDVTCSARRLGRLKCIRRSERPHS